LHPNSVVVLAFQAAIQLELTRRENDKKVIALKMEMMSMMEILLAYVLRLFIFPPETDRL
jgi:hypothetical protein